MAESKRNFIKGFIDKYRNASVIFKASFWFVLVTVINNGVSVLTQPFLNRILTVEEVGTFGVYQTWNSILSVMSTLYLSAGVVEVFLTKNKEDSNHIVASLFCLVIIVWAIFFGCFFIFIKPLSNLLRLKPIYLLLLAIIVLSDSLVTFWSVQKRFAYRYKAYSFLMVVLFISKALMSTALAYFWESDRVLGRILGLCIPSFIVASILLLLMLRKMDFKRLTQYWLGAIKFNIPLIPHYLSSILLASSDKIMIQWAVGEVSVGLYSLAYSYSSLALIVFNALNGAYTPCSLELIKEKNYVELSRKTKPMVLLSVLFSLFLLCLAPEGILLLGGTSYLETLDIVPVLVLGIFFSSFYFIFSNVEFLYEKTKWIFPITLLGTGVNILLNWIFISKYGYKAAAYTTLVSYILVAVCHYAVSVKILKRNIYPMRSICMYVLFLILGAVAIGFLYKLHYLIRYATIVGCLICAVVVFLRYRKKKNKQVTSTDKNKEVVEQ